MKYGNFPKGKGNKKSAKTIQKPKANFPCHLCDKKYGSKAARGNHVSETHNGTNGQIRTRFCEYCEKQQPAKNFARHKAKCAKTHEH